MADIFPSEKAVNMDDAKILIPAKVIKRKRKKKLYGQFRKSCFPSG